DGRYRPRAAKLQGDGAAHVTSPTRQSPQRSQSTQRRACDAREAGAAAGSAGRVAREPFASRHCRVSSSSVLECVVAELTVAQPFPPLLAGLWCELRRGSPKRRRREGGRAARRSLAGLKACATGGGREFRNLLSMSSRLPWLPSVGLNSL